MKWHQARRRQEKWNQLNGGITLSVTIFVALSFLSYSSQDPSFNSFGLSAKVSNYCGYVGAFLSDLFYQIFGLTAWFFIPLGLFLSFRFFRNQLVSKISHSLSLFCLFLVSVSCLLNLYFPKTSFYEGTVSLGGAFAKVVLKSLTPFFHTMGISLILWSVVILSFLLFGQRSFFQFLKWNQKLFIALATFVWFLLKTPTLFLFHKIQALLNKDWSLLFQKLEKKLERRHTNQELANKRPSETLKIESGPQTEARLTLDLESKKQPIHEESKIRPAFREDDETKTTKKFTLKNRPDLNFLIDPPTSSHKMSHPEIESLAKKLIDKLSQFSIDGKITAIKAGPAVIMFEFKPEDNVKVSRIKEMATDLSLALSSESVRIIAPIPGRDVVGIEASNSHREKVYLKNMLKEQDFLKASLPLVLGRRSDNVICIRDLAKIPHLLIAGTTGSGKSVFVISFITSLLFRHTPDTLRLVLIDPKRVDLSAFDQVPHLLSPIMTSASEALKSLNWAISEMEKRYRSLSTFGARDSQSFNEIVKTLPLKEKKEHQDLNEANPPSMSYYFEPLPLICVVIEEFGDLMADLQYKKSIEHSVVRLAQKARASGIHLVLAMQSPRKDIITGLIKTNIPGRISFKVASGTDSRVILDEVGAERLLSHGDMLFLEPGSAKALRYHGPFVSEKEVLRVVKHWKDQCPVEYVQTLDEKSVSSDQNSFMKMEDDPMYRDILNFARSCEHVSASLLQRKFRIGYPRAARLIEILFNEGIIGPPKGSKPREVLVK